MLKSITCTKCNGQRATIVVKNNRPKMLPCKACKGTGKIRVEKGSKAEKVATTRKPSRVEKASAKGKQDAKRSDVTVYTRDMESGEDVKSTRLTDEQQTAKETIEERAAYFQCPGKVRTVRKGPVITLYEFAPAKTTRVKKLINLQEDLALALEAEAVMVRRVPGKDVMGIEISNDESERQNVGFRASLQSVKAAKKAGMELPLNLGTDPFGEPVIDDLARMPHLLIAGSTGSGKSTSLNAIISSLLTVCSPDELEFYMIDPKGVELTHYNGIPHMTEPMVTTPYKAKDMLVQLIQVMRLRLTALTMRKVRDITGYNELAKANGERRMPRIVLIVDELGDLMMQDRREFTKMIAEISQMARATGIHLICATQRPSVDVLSGKIKVNFPGRMAFRVTSSQDSRVIIHKKGAEGLLGKGDMLYQSPTRSALIRIHAPYVPLSDVIAIADRLREVEKQRLEAEAKRLMEEQRKRTPVAPVAAPPHGTQDDSKLDIDISWTASNTSARPKK